MPFRARLKKAFSRSSTGSSSTSVASTTSSGLPIEYYKEDEIPRSKYRGPWNQAHQDRLKSFTFDFGRRASFQGRTSFQGSEYSPAQTRAHSRRSSWTSNKRPSRPNSRPGSISGRSTKSDGKPSRVDQVLEAEGDDDIYNVGMSRRTTRERRGPFLDENNPEASSSEEREDEAELGLDLARQATVTQPQLDLESDTPLPEDELTKALTEATLKPPKSAGKASR